MGIRITEINVQNLGPIDRLSIQPGLLSCIYGQNERGKTFLVEFLIRSLFRQTKEWRMRSPRGSGRITIEGLEEKPSLFSPTSPQKLEDFFEKREFGLPPDFSKLLFVKGAETELVQSEGGVDRNVLKLFLSGADVLERIQKRISDTLQSASVEKGLVIGKRTGELKEKAKLEEELRTLEHLFDQIDKGYSGGPCALLEQDKLQIEKELALLDQAKRYEAFSLSAAIQDLEQKKSQIDENLLKDLRQNVHHYFQKSEEIQRREKAKASAELQSMHYEWLRSALDQYRELLNRKWTSPKRFLLLASALMIGISTACILLQWTFPAIATLFLSFGFVGLYIRQLHLASEQVLCAEELKGIQKEFEVRFQTPMRGLSHLEELLRKQEADYNEARILTKQIEEEKLRLIQAEAEIQRQFSTLRVNSDKPSSWDSKIKLIEEKLRSLTKEIAVKREALARLGVEPEQYLSTPQPIQYDPSRYKALEERKSSIERDLEKYKEKLDQLKQLICHQTGDEITVSWPKLIENLQRVWQEKLDVYRDLYAEILGKIALKEVLKNYQKAEEEKIEKGLNAPEILHLLHHSTGRYTGLRLEGDTLYVLDPLHMFPMAELSTGAQEQTLLALRIGFASRWMRKEKLFLILDDAFQYSDWERRRRMVEVAVSLAREGWQVLYFTMDDHLRDLFDEHGKQFGKDYVRVTLY